MKRYLLIGLVFVILVGYALMAMGSDESSLSSSGTSTATNSENQQKSSDTKEEKTTEVVVPEYVKRAAVTAMTNYNAADSKLHKYSDTSGEPWLYFMYISSWGTWTETGSESWHVEKMELKWYGGYQDDYRFNLDVRFDSTNQTYIISNVYESYKEAGTSTYKDLPFRETHSLFTIPVNFVEQDRDETAVKALDHSDELKKYQAITAFENYGKYMYPYGFKVHSIIGCIKTLQNYDGSWYLEYKVTITNQYGTKIDAVASAYINNVTQRVEDFEVYQQ